MTTRLGQGEPQPGHPLVDPQPCRFPAPTGTSAGGAVGRRWTPWCARVPGALARQTSARRWPTSADECQPGVRGRRRGGCVRPRHEPRRRSPRGAERSWPWPRGHSPSARHRVRPRLRRSSRSPTAPTRLLWAGPTYQFKSCPGDHPDPGPPRRSPKPIRHDNWVRSPAMPANVDDPTPWWRHRRRTLRVPGGASRGLPVRGEMAFGKSTMATTSNLGLLQPLVRTNWGLRECEEDRRDDGRAGPRCPGAAPSPASSGSGPRCSAPGEGHQEDDGSRHCAVAVTVKPLAPPLDDPEQQTDQRAGPERGTRPVDHRRARVLGLGHEHHGHDEPDRHQKFALSDTHPQANQVSNRPPRSRRLRSRRHPTRSRSPDLGYLGAKTLPMMARVAGMAGAGRPHHHPAGSSALGESASSGRGQTEHRQADQQEPAPAVPVAQDGQGGGRPARVP